MLGSVDPLISKLVLLLKSFIDDSTHDRAIYHAYNESTTIQSQISNQIMVNEVKCTSMVSQLVQLSAEKKLCYNDESDFTL
jgi:hypothetical protein